MKLQFDEDFWFIPGDVAKLATDITITDPLKTEKIVLPKGMKVKIKSCIIGTRTADLMTYNVYVPIEELVRVFHTRPNKDAIHELIQETEFNDCDFEAPEKRPLLHIASLNGVTYITLAE